MTETTPDGWYADPWGRWPERYFEAGRPTGRVRYGQAEGVDYPTAPSPPAPSQAAPAQVAPGPPAYAYPGHQQPGYYNPWNPAPQPKGGNQKTGPLPLHPMNVSDILDGAFRLYRANFKAIVLIVSTVSSIPLLVEAVAQRNTLAQGVFSSGTNTGTSDTQLVTTLVAALVNLLVLPFAAGAISKVVASSYLGQQMDAATALRGSLRRFFPLLGAWFVIHLMELTTVLLLVLPGLLIMALCIATAPSIVTEGLGPIQGIRRSWRLMRPNMWRTLGIALLSGLLFLIVAFSIGLPLRTAAHSVGRDWGWILLFLSELMSNLVTLSLSAIVATLLYFDGRIRHEGFDLQVLASSLEG